MGDFLWKVMKDTGKGIKGYVKAQLKLIGITFLILFIGLDTFDVAHPFLISLGISILDMIPVLGIGIVLVPWSIISFIMGNTDLATKIAILFVIAVILRQILEPIIVGKHIGIRPLYTFIATLLGSIVLGPIGIILAPAIAILIISIQNNRNSFQK